jgi:hypothetical protein
MMGDRENGGWGEEKIDGEIGSIGERVKLSNPQP